MNPLNRDNLFEQLVWSVEMLSLSTLKSPSTLFAFYINARKSWFIVSPGLLSITATIIIIIIIIII